MREKEKMKKEEKIRITGKKKEGNKNEKLKENNE